MTKAQREEKARNEKKLQQMLDAGIKVGPKDAATSDSKKKPEVQKKKGKQAQKVRQPPTLVS